MTVSNGDPAKSEPRPWVKPSSSRRAKRAWPRPVTFDGRSHQQIALGEPKVKKWLESRRTLGHNGASSNEPVGYRFTWMHLCSKNSTGDLTQGYVILELRVQQPADELILYRDISWVKLWLVMARKLPDNENHGGEEVIDYGPADEDDIFYVLRRRTVPHAQGVWNGELGSFFITDLRVKIDGAEEGYEYVIAGRFTSRDLISPFHYVNSGLCMTRNPTGPVAGTCTVWCKVAPYMSKY